MSSPSAERFIDPSPWVRLRWLLVLLPVAVGGLSSLDAGLVALPDGWPTRAALAAFGAVAGISNVWLLRALRKDRGAAPNHLFVALLSDTVLLTGVLAVAGGSTNPLSSLYLFPAILAALLLAPTRAWMVLGATAMGYASLFSMHSSHHHGHAMSGHFVGMFVAYAVTAPLVVYAVLRSRAALRTAALRTREAQALRDRTERLTALATLAAGASHELASPLSTILVVAREQEVRAQTDDDLEDARLVREEVLRCQDILHQLSADAGAGMAEVPRTVGIQELLDDAGAYVDSVDVTPADGVLVVPKRLVVQALRRLLGNAREASAAGVAVRLSVETDANSVVFVVSDDGCGMSPEVLERATEPFYTTREEGRGTGLGLFFVESVAHHLGGTLTLDSNPGVGTTARLRLPRGSEVSP